MDDGWMDSSINRWMDVCMNEFVDELIHIWTDV